MSVARLDELRESAVLLSKEPPRFVRGTLYAFVAAAVLLVAWAWFVQIPVLVVATGRVQPAGRLRLVDAEIGGRVVAVHASEHQSVESGAPLLSLDPAPLTLELRGVDRDLETRVPQRDELALMAQRLGAFDREKPPVPDGLRTHKERFTAWIRELELGALLVRRKKEDVERLEKLDKVVSSIEIETAKRGHQESELSFTHTLTKHRADVEANLVAITREIDALETQRARIKDQIDRLEIRAPLRGIVTHAAVRHLGEVVKPGQLLFQIAPEGAGFVAEVWIPGHDAGFVTRGMAARVDLPTFPQALFGWIDGSVSAVAADVSPDSGAAPLYRCEIALSKDRLSARDGRVGQLRLGLETRARLVVRHERLLLRLLGTAQDALRWGP